MCGVQWMASSKLQLECAGDHKIQNNYYNGWTHDHYVSAVLVFCPDGTIPICCYIVPGSIHDSKIAEMGNVYEKLSIVYNKTGAKCTVDSAFSANQFPFLIKSSKQVNIENESLSDLRKEILINAEATSMSNQQSGE